MVGFHFVNFESKSRIKRTLRVWCIPSAIEDTSVVRGDSMTTLSEKLLNDDDRPSVIDDCVALIDAEVASKKGIGGLAIKTAFKTVKAVKPGVIPDAVNFLLDDFVEKLEPFYGQFTQSGESDLASYIVRHADQVADSLLGITDARAQKSRHKTLVKAYQKLRPQGKKQVTAAMPRIGRMLVERGL